MIVCFDNDKAGQEAAQSVLRLFTPNKAKNVTLPMKDAGDMLEVTQGSQTLLRSWWNAKVYQSRWYCVRLTRHGICNYRKQSQTVSSTIEYPWTCLNEYTHGFRATGASYHYFRLRHGQVTDCQRVGALPVEAATEDNIGILALEEDIPKTALGIMSIEANKQLHLPDVTSSSHP